MDGITDQIEDFTQTQPKLLVVWRDGSSDLEIPVQSAKRPEWNRDPRRGEPADGIDFCAGHVGT